MASYSFLTVWRAGAPIERVYELIHHSEDWPAWWSAVESVVELEPGDASGVGNVRRYTFKGELPYKLTFDTRVTRIEPPTALDGDAMGELTGTGQWRLSETDGVTTVRYEWNVRTTRWWMNLLAPLAGPVFRKNHDFVMRSGAVGLARKLDAKVSLVQKAAAEATALPA